MSWEQKPLNAVADFCLGKMLDQNKNRGEPLPYLANVNVRWGDFDFQNLREMRFEPGEIDRYGLRYGDIVMCEGGEPGRCAVWKDQIPGMMIQKALHRIRPHSCLDSSFLFYSFLKKRKNDEFSGLLTGSTIKHLPKEKLAKVKVDVPPIEIQRRIVSILSAYDDLIENNRRRIGLLEEAARMLYREWFVHFRFPGHEHVKIIDGLPEGWERKPLAQLTTKIASGATPKGGESSYKTDGTSLFRSQNIYDYRFEPAGLAFLDEEQAKALSNVEVQPGDVLLNITGASVGRCCVAPRRFLPARVNQHVMIVRADRIGVSPQYLLHSINSPERKKALLNIARAAGATREALTKETVSSSTIPVPPRVLLEIFDGIIGPVHKQQELLSGTNEKLVSARDLLLPRLMNGDIAV